MQANGRAGEVWVGRSWRLASAGWEKKVAFVNLGCNIRCCARHLWSCFELIRQNNEAVGISVPLPSSSNGLCFTDFEHVSRN